MKILRSKKLLQILLGGPTKNEECPSLLDKNLYLFAIGKSANVLRQERLFFSTLNRPQLEFFTNLMSSQNFCFNNINNVIDNNLDL